MHGRRRWVVLAISLINAPLTAELAYESALIDIGEADGVLLHGDLTPGRVDDLVVFTDGGEDRERRMTVYAFGDDGWRVVRDAAVDRDVIFVDVLATAAGDRLLLFRRDHVEWVDPTDWTRRPLVSAPSVYNVPPKDVPRVAIARDINGDGRDDLALPDFDGYWVWLQDAQANGGWTKPVKLAATPTAMSGYRSTTYRPREMYELDDDGDGRMDVAFWEDERFLVYRATDEGFETEPVEIELPVDVRSDDVTVSVGIGGGSDLGKDRVTLYDVGDYNGDGVGDLVTNTLTIDGLLDQRTRYDFHFGKRDAGGGTVFSAVPDTAIPSRGIQGPFDTDDFDNDGAKDFGMATIDIGIGTIIGALLTGSVRFDIDFYVMRDNAYPEVPNVTRPVKIRFSLRTGTITSGRWMNLGDMTGDGLTDLLVPGGGEGIEVYAGTGDASLFADRPTVIAVDFPDTTVPGGVHIADLNDDGRDDLMIRFPPTEDEANRIGVVLSR